MPRERAPAQSAQVAMNGSHATLKETVRKRLLVEDERIMARGLQPDASALPGRLSALVRQIGPLLGPTQAATVLHELVAEMRGLGALEDLFADPTVTEVMVNGSGPVWVERCGRLERCNLILDEATIGQIIERVVAPLGLRIDRASPIVDARLSDGSRFHAVIPPLAIDGPCITIRRFAAKAIALDRFADQTITDALVVAVQARRSIVVSGGTGSGKTTLLNALAAHVPTHERIVTIEDAAELRLPGEHVVRLEARPANAEGFGRVSIRDLLRAALRMRPDRIIVGEVRGGEALDMLQAMNTGHDGSMSTCHANSPEDALRRLEVMALLADVELPMAAVQRQLSSALDLIVQVARCGDGSRRIVSVAAVHERDGSPHCVPWDLPPERASSDCAPAADRLAVRR